VAVKEGDSFFKNLEISMYLFLISILTIIFAIIAVRDFRLAVFLLMASLPAYLLRLEIIGFPTTLLELMIGVVTIFWLINLTKEKKDWSFLKPWLLPISLLVVAGVIGVVVAPDKTSALGIFKAFLIEPILFFIILRTTLKKFDDAEVALMFLGLGALLVAGFAVFQKFTGLSIPIPWDVEGRVTGIFPYPNAVGLYLGPIIILGLGALSRSLEAEFYPRAGFWLLVTILSIVAIFFSQTEAAWLAIPAALLVTRIFINRPRAFAIILAVPILIISLSVPIFREKILLQDYSGSVRLKQWSETTNMLKDHLLFGAGLSGYQTALEPYHVFKEIEIFQYPHNIVLNIWTELGLIGLLAFIFFAWQTIRQFRSAKKIDSPFYWLTLACLTVLVEMTIHGLVDVPFFKNDLAMLTAIIFACLSWSATGPYARQNVEIE
jgi:O-antigen ligase